MLSEFDTALSALTVPLNRHGTTSCILMSSEDVPIGKSLSSRFHCRLLYCRAKQISAGALRCVRGMLYDAIETGISSSAAWLMHDRYLLHNARQWHGGSAHP